MNKRIIIFFGLLLMICSVEALPIYKEYADSTTNTYDNNPEKLNDGNWSNTGSCGSKPCYFLENYSYVNTSFTPVSYQVKYSNNVAVGTLVNLTIPAQCKSDIVKFNITAVSDAVTTVSCYNGSAWVLLSSLDTFIAIIYETGLWVNDSYNESITSCSSVYSAYSVVNSNNNNITEVNLSNITYVSQNLTNVFASSPYGIKTGTTNVLWVNTTGVTFFVVYFSGDDRAANLTIRTTSGTRNISLSNSNFTFPTPLYQINAVKESNNQPITITPLESQSISIRCLNNLYLSSNLTSLNKTSIFIALNNLPAQIRLDSVYSDGTRSYRAVIPTLINGNYSIYMVDYPLKIPVYTEFDIADLLKEYLGGILYVQGYVNSQLVNISSGYIEADNTYRVYLSDTQQYQVLISQADGSNLVNSGWIIGTTSTTIRTITLIRDQNTPYTTLDGITVFVNPVLGNGSIEMGFTDVTGTSTVQFSIFKRNNTVPMMILNASNVSTYNISFQPNDTSAFYIVGVNITRNGLNWSGSKFISIKNNTINLNLPDRFLGSNKTTWMQIISLFIINAIGMMFTAYYIGPGALILALGIIFISFIGWFSLSPIIWGLCLLIAIITNMTKQRRLG